MRYISKAHHEKVIGHMVEKDGALRCPDSGEEAQCVASIRSFFWKEGWGTNEARLVEHPYCPTHASVLEKDLLEVAE